MPLVVSVGEGLADVFEGSPESGQAVGILTALTLFKYPSVVESILLDRQVASTPETRVRQYALTSIEY